jgi:RNA polymerase primary sigma factor
MDQKLRQALGDILDTLTEHEREILEERFGPDGQHINTRDEVAQKLNTTRMDVRKVEAKTLRKFLHPKRMSKLRKVIKCQPSSRGLYCMPMSLQDVIKRNLGES